MSLLNSTISTFCQGCARTDLQSVACPFSCNYVQFLDVWSLILDPCEGFRTDLQTLACPFSCNFGKFSVVWSLSEVYDSTTNFKKILIPEIRFRCSWRVHAFVKLALLQVGAWKPLTACQTFGDGASVGQVLVARKACCCEVEFTMVSTSITVRSRLWRLWEACYGKKLRGLGSSSSQN